MYYVYMYVLCINVYMYVCMYYVCKYVCMYIAFDIKAAEILHISKL